MIKFKFQGKTVQARKTDDGNYGINNLKIIAQSIVLMAEKVKARAKGGLNWWEIFRTGLDVSSIAGDVAQDWEDLKNEVTDLSEDEAGELAEFLMEQFDLDRDVAYQYIENIVIAGISVIFDGIKIYKNINSLVKEKK